MLINEYLKDFRFRSFFIEKALVCRMLVLFFQVSSSGWVSLTIDEGVLRLSVEDSEPMLLDINDIDDEFAYPVETAFEFNSYIGRKITNISEYRLEGIEDGCIGVYIECGNEGFSVVEEGSCLFLFDGIYQDFQENTFLSRLNI